MKCMIKCSIKYCNKLNNVLHFKVEATTESKMEMSGK